MSSSAAVLCLSILPTTDFHAVTMLYAFNQPLPVAVRLKTGLVAYNTLMIARINTFSRPVGVRPVFVLSFFPARLVRRANHFPDRLVSQKQRDIENYYCCSEFCFHGDSSIAIHSKYFTPSVTRIIHFLSSKRSLG